jgi:MoxR-like ATPase
VKIHGSNNQNLPRPLSFPQPRALRERKTLAVSILALFCGEHLFFYGPPGVAKSLLARRLRLCLKDSRHFEYLMGRFSVPEEIFGPFSLSALKDSDQFRRKTEGYLPEADIAFLDEIWRSSSLFRTPF